MMAELSWDWSSVSAIGVNSGPGTFTGIRVGLAVAKAICFVHERPLVAVDMFDCLALGYHQSGEWSASSAELLVLLEGQLQTCLLARYRREERLIRRVALTALPQTELARHLKSSVPVAGILDRLRQWLPDTVEVLGRPPWDESRPGIGNTVMQRVAERRFDDPLTIEPFYVRPSSAEEKWDRRSN
jgi:tRNA threonylcarbamoyladenosine biosynthesis protein TsaB